MLCLSGFEQYSRWVPLKPTRTALGSPFPQLFHHEFQSSQKSWLVQFSVLGTQGSSHFQQYAFQRYNGDVEMGFEQILRKLNQSYSGRTHMFVINETMLEGQLLSVLYTSTYFYSPNISINILCRIYRPNQIYYPKERTQNVCFRDRH